MRFLHRTKLFIRSHILDFLGLHDTSVKARIDKQIVQDLLKLDKNGSPNLHMLAMALRDVPWLHLNAKVFGYELARRLADQLPTPSKASPKKVGLAGKASTQADIESDWLAHWCGELTIPVVYHRKIWEFAYLLQVLFERDTLLPGKRGLGFGCGAEPIASYLAKLGIDVVVTDLPPSDQRTRNWTSSNEYMKKIDTAFHAHLVERSQFDQHVTLQFADMNDIPQNLSEFDFCWSICALEHLGSIAAGLRFIQNSLTTLKPGGLAVHTTELNIDSSGETPDNCPTVLFQKKHFQLLKTTLEHDNHFVSFLDFDLGSGILDRFIDTPPYHHDASDNIKHILGSQYHLKLAVDGFATTCFGLFIIKDGLRLESQVQ